MAAFRPPMRLFIGDVLVGEIVTYGYETPWATGRIQATDESLLSRMVSVCALNDEIETWEDAASVDEDDLCWDAALTRRGIGQADVDLLTRGPFSVQLPDGEQVPLRSPPIFDDAGFVMWRW